MKKTTMKIAEVKLKWFRGASDEIALKSGGRSLVIYGENGSGKSSFVDGVEYILNQGRVKHLAHEHSGRRQEKAVLNTHIPNNETGKILITLEDNSCVDVSILRNGNFSITPEGNDISKWGYQHTILRQNELADFITDTKGGKYSSLLPLLGLRDLEIAAENLRQLEKAISELAGLAIKKDGLEKLKQKAKSFFGEKGEFNVELERLYKKYLKEENFVYDQKDNKKFVDEILSTLKEKIEKFSAEQKVYAGLLEISKLTVNSDIKSVRQTALKMSQLTEPLINERLSILQETSIYAEKLTRGETINCPACGRSILVDLFQDHVTNENQKLKEASDNFDNYKKSIQSLGNTLLALKRLCEREEISEWMNTFDTPKIEYLTKLDIDQLRQVCNEDDLQNIELHLQPIIDSAAESTKDSPPEIQELLDNQEKARLMSELINSQEVYDYVSKIGDLIILISNLQKRVREKIRIQSTSTIGSISDDIARMWDILHPSEKIEDVHLYLPTDTDKAIEIGLKFFGIEQPSPRLTLSEGHRNSLGLCIFLSMAKHNIEKLPPIFLDDVVVSFDRGHRGMVVELLEKEFSDRQIILFTHDREWFIELKQVLNQALWDFRVLMPWIDPTTGIRWSEKDSTFDDARALLEIDPAAAGNRIRAIMDIHLAIISEKLEIKLPYLHRERNDHRTAHDFLAKIIVYIPICFEIKNKENKYESYDSTSDIFKKADCLLLAWANRASHSFDAVKSEAQTLIEVCEEALNVFNCPSCKRMVTRNDDTIRRVRQCTCGMLRWRYGKS